MKIGTKIIVAALAAVVLCVVVGLFVQRKVIRDQGIALTRDTMRVAIMEAESTRESIAGLNRRNAFDRAALLADFQKSSDMRETTLYKTVPVVAAWTALEQIAEKEKFEFRVPKRQARNPRNTPTPEEEKILAVLETGKAEDYFKVDEAQNQIIYARPIVLSSDCLTCHGDPKSSPSGDGKDLLGFQMENWKAGEVHGAFVLKSKLDRVDAVVKANMITTLLWMLPVVVAIAAGIFFFTRSNISRPLSATIASINSATEQAAQASLQFSQGSQALAAGASEQAASLEETSASLEEIASLTKRNAENAQQANELASQTRAAADAGVSDMQAMTDAMGDIKSASDNIGKIIKTIDEIAFQTNLLALNAAVEAARAGEAGAGFAVVADEVRGLAQRSAQAAKETESKIKDSIQKSENGVRISAKVAGGLEGIVGKARQLDELVAQITLANKEQSQGIGQVNMAVSQMEKVISSNAASSEESAGAAEELNTQTQCLRDAVASLVALVGDNAGVKPGVAHPAPARKPKKSPPPGRQSSPPLTDEREAAFNHPPAPVSARVHAATKDF
jgi:methyl-accepting chemotaxis protein